MKSLLPGTARNALSTLQAAEGGDPSRSDGEGEVGIAKRAGIPHLTPALSAPGGGEGVVRQRGWLYALPVLIFAAP